MGWLYYLTSRAPPPLVLFFADGADLNGHVSTFWVTVLSEAVLFLSGIRYVCAIVDEMCVYVCEYLHMYMGTS